MTVIICPGVHSPQLTQRFLNIFHETPVHYWVYPVDRYPAYSSWHLLHWLRHQLEMSSHLEPSSHTFSATPASVPASTSRPQPSFTFLGFSAGVVAAAGAAWGWHLSGGRVNALIAIDGWGVPLNAPFLIHRMSHDYITHWSSALLGAGADRFYADPPVDHLEIWRSPHLTPGWRIPQTTQSWPSACPLLASIAEPGRTPISAANFIRDLLRRYQELSLMIDPCPMPHDP